MNKTLSILAVGAVLAILVVSFGMVSATSSNQPEMVGSQWAVYGETTLPNGGLDFHPIAHATTISTGGVEFNMPDSNASEPTFVNYLLNTYTASLTESNTISATITIDATSSSTTFWGNSLWLTEYGSSVTPVTVRLFIQANLPNNDTTILGHYGDNYNYWWSDSAYISFSSGSTTSVTISAILNPADWSSINGLAGDYNTSVNAAFDQALANIKYVGISFGSGYFYASGVGVNYNTGTAVFELTDYTVT